MLSEFGCDYIELTNPAASPQSRNDCEAICKLGLKAKILTHTRCTLEDAKLAQQEFLREHSLGGKDMVSITKQAIEVIQYIKSRGCEVRFSSEDSFRSDLVDLLSIYRAVTLLEPFEAVSRPISSSTMIQGVLWRSVTCSKPWDEKLTIPRTPLLPSKLVLHTSTHLCSELGKGMASAHLGPSMMPTSRDYILSKYKLHQLKAIEDFVAEAVEINVPFNNPITGFCAFTHKAGIHAKAILNSPSTYEILKPEDFGLSSVHFTSRLTGWNAIKSRVDQLGLDANSWPEDKIREVTAKIKQMADLKVMTLDETDALIRSFHLDLQKGHS
ncbi:hypothetical protein ONZ43_g152 [Nemania bipapillata]|uniref:Uncharacterized protein n=1 Tax=Nemania bipapillata TaxID=110536 RepID=A0ACC2J963_9PEZI|nr:hypothetical protein ONZ43_g152 [Nemania bipapillata]